MATIIIQNCLYSPGHGVYQSFTGSHWNALPLLHDDVAELADIWAFAHTSTFRLRILQRCSNGFNKLALLYKLRTDYFSLCQSVILSVLSHEEIYLNICRNVRVVVTFVIHCIIKHNRLSIFITKRWKLNWKYNTSITKNKIPGLFYVWRLRNRVYCIVFTFLLSCF